MKNDSYGLISRLNMDKDLISELEDRSLETCQVEMRRGKKRMEKKKAHA